MRCPSMGRPTRGDVGATAGASGTRVGPAGFLTKVENETLMAVVDSESCIVRVILRMRFDHKGESTVDQDIIAVGVASSKQHGWGMFWRITRSHRSFESQRCSDSLTS